MKGTIGWVLRIGLVILTISVGVHRIIGHKTARGFVVGLTSPTCSVEQMRTLSPLLEAQLLPDGNIRFEMSDIESHAKAVHLLSLLNRTKNDGLLLVDGDESLAVEEMATFLSEARSAMPGWKILLVTAKTRSACELLIKTRAVPAA